MGRLDVLEAFIEREAPDIIVHPSLLTGPFINDLLLTAKRNDIPMIVCMNSWDNASSKAVCTAHPDWLVVWGEQSRQEAITYMNMPEERIKCFGAAQFQVYRTPPSESRAELCELFGVPEDKHIVVYAGINYSLMETEYLRMLDEAVEREFLANCHILYRPHPWRGRLMEGEADFFSLDWKHISMDPHMVDYYKREIASPSRKLFMADYQITNKLLTLADAVISPRSTILIEALIKRKPVLVFFPEEQEFAAFSTEEIYFKDFIELEMVNVCLQNDRFFDHCAIADSVRLAELFVEQEVLQKHVDLSGAPNIFVFLIGAPVDDDRLAFGNVTQLAPPSVDRNGGARQDRAFRLDGEHRLHVALEQLGVLATTGLLDPCSDGLGFRIELDPLRLGLGALA